jgi:hypothetical protein
VVLQPGETITLQIGDAHYFAEHSAISWPLALGTPVYAQVDSAGDASYGAVREMDEIRGDTYNNVHGTTVAPGTGAAAEADTTRPISPTRLPPR